MFTWRNHGLVDFVHVYSAVGCIVVNVEYRLAPDFPFPASIDDGCTVAQWVLQHKTIVGTTALNS